MDKFKKHQLSECVVACLQQFKGSNQSSFYLDGKSNALSTYLFAFPCKCNTILCSRQKYLLLSWNNYLHHLKSRRLEGFPRLNMKSFSASRNIHSSRTRTHFGGIKCIQQTWLNNEWFLRKVHVEVCDF